MAAFACLWLCPGAPKLGGAAEPAASADDLQFFETKVRPVLANRCFGCHGEEKQKGDLRLDSRAAMLAGGESGPSIEPGKPDESLLIEAVRHASLEMPPDGKLPSQQVDDLARWIQLGAPWPASEGSSGAPMRRGEFQISDADRAYWAYQRVQPVAPPSVADPTLVANPIDAFLAAGLERVGLRPNPPATRRDLLRRATFDLIGLPPTPDELEAFERDEAPDAWERQIDRLLARSEYGERWGRHWLDVVRYGQTDGYERDGEKLFAWRYRDYVIRALNADMPYDQFVREQLAGDLLKPPSNEALIATGYYRLGVWDDEPDDKRQAVFDELDDILTTTGQAFLGTTINCARCHDHKIDPVSQRDYYRLLSLVRPLKGYEIARFDLDSATLAPLGDDDKIKAWRDDFGAKLREIEAQLKAAADAKDEDQQQRLRDMRAALRKQKPPFEMALVARDSEEPTPRTQVLVRGNSGTPGDEVDAGFPEVFSLAYPAVCDPGKPGRLALAEWIASAQHPLTARVLVNRVWRHHFGRGLVSTPNDFGKAGPPPTHPELLDWLAADFVASGWRIKSLHKRILLSNAWRMSTAAARPEAIAKDEGNQLYWRQNPRRLEAEAIRDAMLAVSGQLNPAMGGRGFFPRVSREVVAGQSRPGLGWEISPPEETRRRSIYAFIKRTMPAPEFETFDYTNTAISMGDRPVTTVAPQALLLLNSDFVIEQARALADRLARECPDDLAAQIRRGYALCVGRPPSESELAATVGFVHRYREQLRQSETSLQFAPTVPGSLSSGYLESLKPADFLSGPRGGWNYYRGDWSDIYEGIASVHPAQGPFALAEHVAMVDGQFSGQIKLRGAAELGGVLVCAVPDGDGLAGYELAWLPRQGVVELRRHAQRQSTTLASARAPATTETWHAFRIEVQGARRRVWLDDAVEPAFSVIDDAPLVQPGRVGVRTMGGGCSIKNWSVRPAELPAETPPLVVAAGGPPSEPQARRAALEAACSVLLNLNEFVYVN